MTTILYAEDDDNDVFFMKRAFTKACEAGRLVVVSDGVQAVSYVLGRDKFADRAAHPSPSFVLLDLKMPNLTGIEALREMRADSGAASLPVILLTSSTQEADIAAAHTLGANGFFVKPSNATELVDLLRSFADSCPPKTENSSRRLAIPGNQLPT